MARSLQSCDDNATEAPRRSYFASLFDDEPLRTAPRKTAAPQPATTHYPPDMRAFVALGERMLRSARQRRHALSLLVLQASELPELEILFGRDAAALAVHAVMSELATVAGRHGLAVRTSPDTFALVLPGCTGEDLEAALRRRLGQACSVEVNFREEEIVLVPDVQARTVEGGTSIEKTYSVVCRTIESARYMEALRRDHLRREREAHSTHMSLPPELAQEPELQPSRAWRSTLPATIAMPLGRR